MEGHRHRYALTALIAAAVALTTRGAANAGEKRDTEALSDNAGVELTFTRKNGSLVAIDSRRSRSASSCQWSVAPYAVDPLALDRLPTRQTAPNPESRLYLVLCNGNFSYAQWIGPQNTVDIDGLASDLAEQEIRRVSVVPLEIGINPVQGLTGVESWFWTEGYTGDPIEASVGAFGITVGVRIVPSSVTWDFGDGTPPIVGDFGRPYPERSSVVHAYTERSAAGPYTVTATFEFRPTFSIDGGPAQALPPIRRSVSTQYVVREAQAVGR